MKSVYASGRFSSGVLAATLALTIPMRAAIAISTPEQLETNGPQVHTTIEEWHWRNMAF